MIDTQPRATSFAENSEYYMHNDLSPEKEDSKLNKMAINKSEFESLLRSKIVTDANFGSKSKTVYQMVYETEEGGDKRRPIYFTFNRIIQFPEVRLLFLLSTIE